jgi:hypothetical protein
VDNTTIAGRILNPHLIRTLKDRRDMADFWAVSPPQWLGKDMYAWAFSDGSQLMMVYDENLRPVEIVEV